MTQIMRIEVPQARRTEVVSSIFGLHFPLSIEPYIYNLASSMSQQYQGGYWEFYQLSNGGFYMGLADGVYPVCCHNGYAGSLTGDALGIVVCMYAFSHFSFSDNDILSRRCGSLYHQLRDFAARHTEFMSICRATD